MSETMRYLVGAAITYRLWATSHPPLDATSNTLRVEVTAN